MKKLSPRQWAGALLVLIIEAKEKEVPDRVGEFISLLYRHRATRQVPLIIRQYAALVDKQNGVTRVATSAARALSKSVIKRLEEFGDEVVIDHTIDPTMIGGLKLTIGDVIIDGTVAMRLKQLYET